MLFFEFGVSETGWMLLCFLVLLLLFGDYPSKGRQWVYIKGEQRDKRRANGVSKEQ